MLRESSGLPVHIGGTYVNMDGPAFSTAQRARPIEARLRCDRHDQPREAKLAREAEIALATMAMITDYDCWKVERSPSRRDASLRICWRNAESARRILAAVIPRIQRL
jgi:5'-methylthioadenosine phosphorylase